MNDLVSRIAIVIDEERKRLSNLCHFARPGEVEDDKQFFGLKRIVKEGRAAVAKADRQ